MKRIILCIFIILVINNTVYANSYNIDEAVDMLIPYEDEHIMTRDECIIALARMVGLNDDESIIQSYLINFDVNIRDDIDYYSFKGRTIFFANDLFGEQIIPTRKDFYFDDTNFYGEYPASAPDVISWMLGVLHINHHYVGKDNLIDCANNTGLLTSNHDNIQSKITAYVFKTLAKKFMMCTAYHYINPKQMTYQINISLDSVDFRYENPNLKYIDVFNNTYRDKNIYLKKDGIYLGDKKIKYEGVPPFIDDNGIMLMPVRWLAQLFGFDAVEFDEDTGYVFLTDYKWLKETSYSDKIKMAFQNNSSSYEFLNSNINVYDFETPAKIIDGHMYVPLRSVCESLMYNVIWY